MKPLFAVVLFVAALPMGMADDASIEAAQSCSPSRDLCPTCDGHNVTGAAGFKYAITCDFTIEPEKQHELGGWVSNNICMEACDKSPDCFGVTFAPNGSCSLAKGHQKGLTQKVGYSNLFRLPKATATPTSTSHLQTTTTLYRTTTSKATVSSTTAAPAPSESRADTCDLELTNLCPSCNGKKVTDKENKAYQIVCDHELHSSNGTYSIQHWESPEGCLAQCDAFPLCKGAIYYDDRDCELAKGDDIYTVSKVGHTAFVPVPTGTSSLSASSTSQKSHSTTKSAQTTKTQAPPASSSTVTILPVDAGCDVSAVTCPACNGMPYVDQLNASYTVLCDFESVCVGLAAPQGGAQTSQKLCVEDCDQDATCLAALWYPKSSTCKLCQEGMDKGPNRSGLPYIVFAADLDESGNTTMTSSTTTHRSTTISPPTPYPTLSSITDFPTPFPTSTSSLNVSSRGPIGPVGPVLLSSSPVTTRTKYFNPGGPIVNLTKVTTSTAISLTASAVSTQNTNTGAVSCPAYNNNVYVEPSNGHYFAVGCDNVFAAEHSRYISASDFEACARSCTGQCDGVQYGYTTRCGLYTSISVVASGSGWTVAASITFPTPTPLSMTTKAAVHNTLAKVTQTAVTSKPKVTGPHTY